MKHLEAGFRLGEWTVEPLRNRLSRAGKSVALEARAMDVLVLLASRPGEVVSADELIDQVWDGRALSDNPVYKVVATLRRALGDSRADAQYIETITKRGYRLIPEAVPLEAEPPSRPRSVRVPVEAEAAHGSVPGQLSRWLLLVGLLGLGAIISLILWAWPERSSQPAATPVSLEPLISVAGSSTQPALDPAGRRIAFVNDSSGHETLWLLELASGQVQQITNNELPDSAPAWSPTEDRLLFNRGGDIWSLILGGEPEPLIESAQNGAWSPDGERIVFERGPQLWLSRADGLEQRRLDRVPALAQRFAPRRPKFSPDGRLLVYFESTEGPLGDVWTVQLQDGLPQRLTFDEVEAGAPRFTKDGRWIVFHSRRSGRQAIWRIRAEGGEPEQLLVSTGDDRWPVLSDDGSLFFASRRSSWTVVVTDPRVGTTRELHESPLAVAGPELSPDQREVVFFGFGADGQVGVSVVPLEGGEVRAVVEDAIMPKWAADGGSIAYYDLAGEGALRRISARGGESEVLANGWRFTREHDAALSPDGRRVVYARMEGDAVVESRMLDLATGADLPMEPSLSWMEWSPTGDRIAGTLFSSVQRPTGPILMCSASDDGPGDCEELDADAQHPVWSSSGDAVYYVRPTPDARIQLWRRPLAADTSELVTELGPTWRLGPFFDVTRDGRVVWVRYEQGRSELWRATW